MNDLTDQPKLHDGEGYTGAADLLVAEVAEPVPVALDLRGAFQPIDGRFHWYGRIAASTAVDELVSSGATVTLRTAYGESTGRVSDRDPWGRYRVTGTGRPPFPV